MKLIFFSCPARFTSLMAIMCAFAIAMAGCSAKADSESKPAAVVSPMTPPLTEAQIKAKYQNCPGGYYSGPRPGKTRFAQDPWIWAVTPEFARRFCMPAEFISAELKGAEAVAFRVLRKTDSVNCGYANNSAVCFGEPVLRFDVYIKSDAELPRKHKLPIYHVPDMPSSQMISVSTIERQSESKYVTENPTPYGYPHFKAQQVALQGVRGGIVEWPITGLGEQEHRAQAFEGIDYYSFEGLSGSFQNARMLNLKIADFQITFKPLNEKPRQSDGRKTSEFPYAIKFPMSFSAAMIEEDIKHGRNFSRDIRDAFVGKQMVPASK